MTDLQRAFYIVIIIALGLFAIFQIAVILILFAIQRKIARATRKFHFIAREIRELARSGRSYSRYVGAGLIGSIFKGILRMLHRQRSYEDNY